MDVVGQDQRLDLHTLRKQAPLEIHALMKIDRAIIIAMDEEHG